MIIQTVLANNPQLLELISELDAGLKVTDGDEHAFYHQFNGLDQLNKIYIGYVNGQHLACGGFKLMDRKTAELKRMYVREEFRGKRYAEILLKSIESELRNGGVETVLLETGVNQKSALKLYQRNEYFQIQNYGQYEGKELSICMKKLL